MHKSKYKKLSGSSYTEVYKQARLVYKVLEKKTKRRPYIKSVYFGKQKVFFDYYWVHLRYSRGYKERMRRLVYFEASLDVIRNSRICYSKIPNRNNRSEVLYRFLGTTKDNFVFYVQIKEDLKTGRKYFMSCFPKN